MDKSSRPAALIPSWFVTVLTPLLAAIATITSAYFAFVATSAKTQVDALNVALKEQEVALEQRRLEAEQQARKEGIITTYVPKLVSGDEAERRAATAVLFVLYPNEAKDILARVAASVGDEAKPALEAVVVQAEALASRTGPWAIVAASEATLERAQAEVERAKAQGYSPTMIYKQDEWFNVVVGSFPTQNEAQQALVAIRAKIRDNAFVVDLSAWCNAPVGRGAYFECQPK